MLEFAYFSEQDRIYTCAKLCSESATALAYITSTQWKYRKIMQILCVRVKIRIVIKILFWILLDTLHLLSLFLCFFQLVKHLYKLSNKVYTHRWIEYVLLMNTAKTFYTSPLGTYNQARRNVVGNLIIAGQNH